MKLSNAGQILEHAIRSRNINISGLSRRLHVNRRTLYNCFSRDKVRMEVICSIGHAINYDFAEEFKDEFLASGMKIILSGIDQVLIVEDQPQKSLHYWMQKYVDLLEDYNALLKHPHQPKICQPDD
jgi:hypothetical protein